MLLHTLSPSFLLQNIIAARQQTYKLPRAMVEDSPQKLTSISPTLIIKNGGPGVRGKPRGRGRPFGSRNSHPSKRSRLSSDDSPNTPSKTVTMIQVYHFGF